MTNTRKNTSCASFKSHTPILVLSFLTFALWLNGCASFPGKEIPSYTYSDLGPPPQEKTCLVSKPTGSMKDADREVIDRTFAMLEKSGFFLKAPEHCSPNGEKIQNSIKWDFRIGTTPGNTAVAIISGFISGFTFTLLPGFERDYVQLTVQQRKNDQVLKEYVYRENIDTWVHFSLLFMMPSHRPYDVWREIYDRMVMSFLYDYSCEAQTTSIAIDKSNRK